MGAKTNIEWTDATWSPVTGCTKVSPGCDHCYAESIAHRFAGTKAYPNGFDVTLRPERLDIPLRWKRPRRVFVNSMSDLFHDAVPESYIGRVWEVMARCPQHTFQILTKRHARMRSWMRHNTVLPNVWLGVSVENQQWADIRIPALLDTPAAVRFLSCEPLLGPVEIRSLLDWRYTGEAHHVRPDWVIVGGESGPGARPMRAAWARSLRSQCESAGVPFLFKQWGEWMPTDILDPRAQYPSWPDTDMRLAYAKVGKRAAGRELDGRTWDEYPEVSRG